MKIETFLDTLKQAPESIDFSQTMAVIETNYSYQPTRFENGSVINDAGQNEGSCKLFAFAKDQGLSQDQTLACFGQYYWKDVLQNPQGTDHANIRQFMITGWDGVKFDDEALIKT